MWQFEKTVSKGDYNYVVIKNHPKASEFGYVLEHRAVMENFLNRVLLDDEVVHHINGIKKDNRIENLQLLSTKQHNLLHRNEQGKEFIVLKCPECKNYFEREKRQTHLAKKKKYTTCSPKCRGSFSRKIQLGKVNLEEEIKDNILFKYKRYIVE